MKVLTLAAAAALVCGPAMAADLSLAHLDAVSGKVMVASHGKLAAANAGALRAGDRVVASADGKAQVKFADGCVVKLAPASMLTVSAKSPCASGAGLVKAQSNQTAQVEPLFSPTTDAIVATVASVAIVAVIVSSANDSGSP